ncbi:MAG TPA: SGNH/GDSL hydrolase family protein [Thermoguttaceae bacterium]|nr:SGNH/GDSL hydrolase family protein [Thermoguttaceae bacterium]
MKYRFVLMALALVLVLSAISASAAPPPSRARNAVKPKADPSAVFAEITDDPKLPRVLLIGDSISMGYTFPVRRMLAGKANVHRVPMNGGDTARGLDQLDAWLGEKPWDVIHFNFGLHDLKHMKNGRADPRGDQVRSPEEYAENLDKLVVRLKATGATLIWATTTPVPAGAGNRVAGDEILFNNAAAKIMKRHGVKVNDLCTYVAPHLAKYQYRRNVHFNPKGSEFLGRKVADAISAVLAERGGR